MTLLYTNNLQSIKNYGILRRNNWFVPRNFMKNITEVLALLFQAHANYGTWSTLYKCTC